MTLAPCHDVGGRTVTAHSPSQGEAGKDAVATGWTLTRSPHGTGIQGRARRP